MGRTGCDQGQANKKMGGTAWAHSHDSAPRSAPARVRPAREPLDHDANFALQGL
jgi:hypothetical protein